MAVVVLTFWVFFTTEKYKTVVMVIGGGTQIKFIKYHLWVANIYLKSAIMIALFLL